MIPKLITVWPQKGGIGKSFVLTLLHDYLAGEELAVRTFDLDHANSTFSRYVPETTFVDTEVDADKLGALDQLVAPLIEKQCSVIVADNRAAGGDKLERWLTETDLVRQQAELGFALIFVAVAVDDKDAISQIADLLDRHGSAVRWLVARNLREGPTLPLFDASTTRKRLREAGAIEIEIPCLAELTRNRLQLANLTVAAGQAAQGLPILDRSRCIRYTQTVRQQLDGARRLLLE